MMLIDIRKLNAQKKYAGSLEFDFDAPETLIQIPFVKFSLPVKVEFDYEIFEDELIIVSLFLKKCRLCIRMGIIQEVS